MSTEMHTQPASLLGAYKGSGEMQPLELQSHSKRIIYPACYWLVLFCLFIGGALFVDSRETEATHESRAINECLYALENASYNSYTTLSGENYSTLHKACLDSSMRNSWTSGIPARTLQGFTFASIFTLLFTILPSYRFYEARIRFKASPAMANYWRDNYTLRARCVKPRTQEQFQRLIAEATAADQQELISWVAEKLSTSYKNLLDEHGVPGDHPVRQLDLKEAITSAGLRPYS